MSEEDQDLTPGTGDGGDTGDQIDIDIDPAAGDDGAGEGDGGDPSAAPAPGGGEPPKSRAERRQLWKEHQALKQRLDSREQEWRQRDEASARRTEALLEELKAIREEGRAARPRPEHPKVKELNAVRTKLNGLMKRMAHLPAEAQAEALEDYHDLMEQRERLNGELAAEQVLAARDRQNPRPVPPSREFKAFAREFPFVDPDASDYDGELRAMVNAKAGRIARAKGRDMENPRVRWSTLREAAAWVAQQEGLDVPGNGGGSRPPASPGRVTGNGNRTSGGAGGGNGLDALDMASVDAAAEAMYPEVADSGERRKKWLAGPGKRITG